MMPSFASLLLYLSLFAGAESSKVCRCQCTCPLDRPLRGTRHLHSFKPSYRSRNSRLRLDESPPEIIEHPTDLAVFRGEPATLNCRAEGRPQPIIEWYRNGERVETSKDDPLSQRTLLPHGSLFFYQLNQGRKGKSDEGIYTCVARNHLGYALSKNASLYVASLREEFRLQPSSVVVALGEQADMECLPPRGHPEPTVTWKKDGVPLNETDDHYRVTVGKLTIFYTLRSDSGMYVCVATNKVGQRESRAARVSVLEKPTFVQRPSDETVIAGNSVQFSCKARGDPMPRVRWKKENGELPTGRYEVNSDNTIRIHYTALSDAGLYTCLAENSVGSSAASVSLIVQDALDTGQKERRKATQRELLDVRVYLHNITILPSSSHVHLHWKVVSPSQYIEGFNVFFRSLMPLSTDWMVEQVTNPAEEHTVLTTLRRGYKYEFKVQAYSGKFCSPDSNTRHGRIPEEVPDAPPHSVIIATTESRNDSIVVSWKPPPPESHNGIIKGYKVWCLGNDTQHHRNWTVNSSTHQLEIPAMNSGIEYRVQIAAINGAGVGVHTKPQYVYLDPSGQETSSESSIFGRVLEFVRRPVFIASAGSVIWVILMVLSVCLYCRRTKRGHIQKQHKLSKGMYRLANEDIIIKHRMNLIDSPWLSNSWKSNSCSKNLSAGGTRPLWLHSWENQMYREAGSSFEKTPVLRVQGPTLLSDNSLNGTFSTDIKGKDLKTFSTPLVQRSTISNHSVQMTPDHSPLPLLKNNINRNNINSFGQEVTKLPQKMPPYLQPNVEFWDKNCNKGNIGPVMAICRNPTTRNVPGAITSPENTCKGEGKTVMKTFCSPKAQHRSFGLRLVDALPPPPPRPVEEPGQVQGPEERQSKSTKNSESNMVSPRRTRKECCSSSGDKLSTQTTCYSHQSTATFSLSANNDTAKGFRPEQVAQYLELTDEGRKRHFTDNLSTFERPFSPPHTYGYICGPQLSDLETDTVDYDDEDEDLDMEVARVNSHRYFHRLCHSPTSSISECESSLAGSLANGWGSVSEDNFTSARCSMVSSSDGSFLMDANFAQALAVAVDSFCFGLAQPERETPYTALSSSSFLPTAFPDTVSHNPTEGSEVTSVCPESDPAHIWDWNLSWADELEDKIAQKVEITRRNPMALGKDLSKPFRNLSDQQQQGKSITDVYNSGLDVQVNPTLSAVHVSFATVGTPVHKSFAVRRKVDKVGLLNFPVDANGLTMVKV
ncbi:roundabout homolog 4 isoform X2 [Pristis pectinata]|uniref:roundabout homolog 4 isoform X2 n=1 Tax=Pristis pectinata TaxID=685728 RepID=UPI00223CFDB1|nr:roundabout homolog 4 isoform X2 [Pristis pectinata]